ncbi:MAG: hypothetical protein J7494_06255 [Sphingobium sp.]|nr:hypothetical protein [Sphingobium sp.]
MKMPLLVPILTCSALVGCQGPAPVKQDLLVGEYVYKSEDPDDKPTDHELDHLTLRRDGRYLLVQGGSTKPRTISEGAWTTSDGGDQGTHLLLDHSGYPVRIDGNETKLLIDTDTGIWFTKVK